MKRRGRDWCTCRRWDLDCWWDNGLDCLAPRLSLTLALPSPVPLLNTYGTQLPSRMPSACLRNLRQRNVISTIEVPGAVAHVLAIPCSPPFSHPSRTPPAGYLESLHHLRQRIMMDEWEGGGRQRALRRAVADLEAQLAERAEGGQGGQADGGQAGGDTKEGQQGGMALSWEELSELYKVGTAWDEGEPQPWRRTCYRYCHAT